MSVRGLASSLNVPCTTAKAPQTKKQSERDSAQNYCQQDLPQRECEG
jgi:hypothetical protein